MDDNPELVRRLDLILATLQLVFEPQLAAARDAIRQDNVNRLILDETEDWVSSTDLQQRVAKAAKVDTRTVRTRLPTLVERRVLAARGSERKQEYRRTGLI